MERTEAIQRVHKLQKEGKGLTEILHALQAEGVHSPKTGTTMKRGGLLSLISNTKRKTAPAKRKAAPAKRRARAPKAPIRRSAGSYRSILELAHWLLGATGMSAERRNELAAELIRGHLT